MKPALRKAAVVLLLLPLAGCSRKTKVVIPPESVAPAPPMSAMVQLPSLPPIPPPVLRPVVLATVEPDRQPPQPVHAKRSHHKQKTAEETATEQNQAPAASTAAPPTQQEQAVNAQPSDMSPIGQLSTSNDNSPTQLDRHAIIELITSTENGLNAIKNSLTDEQQKTAVQIRTFLTKANDALKVDDLAGANTLATKAHLLLDELTKQ
jgi:predicted small lipoprotein YifL